MSSLSITPVNWNLHNKKIKHFIRSAIPEVKRITPSRLNLMKLFLSFKLENITILANNEVFIPTREMRSFVMDYALVRDACFIMKGFSSRDQKKCDLIVGYMPQFDALFYSILIDEIKIRKRSKKTRDSFFPGARLENYKQVPTSARHYIWLQNLPKDLKKEIYSGQHDVDIVSCFPNIFWKEVLKEETNNDMMHLMIDEPELFILAIIADDIPKKLWPNKLGIHNDRNSAKMARSRLFHPPSSGRKHRKCGVAWYDQLQDYITYHLNQLGISDSHLFFTTIEQKIIRKAIEEVGEDTISLRMHDGFICTLEDPEEAVKKLKETTGYSWSYKTL